MQVHIVQVCISVCKCMQLVVCGCDVCKSVYAKSVVDGEVCGVCMQVCME